MNKNVSIGRIIAKLDNDFNPDGSDWIPRVGAWCYDAINQIGGFITKKVNEKVEVINNYVTLPNAVNGGAFKVYDTNGCEIKEARGGCVRHCSSTGGAPTDVGVTNTDISHTTSCVNSDTVKSNDIAFAETINDTIPHRWNVKHINTNTSNCDRNYVIIRDGVLELNFQTTHVCVEYEVIATEKDTLHNCEFPIIPNIGVVIEAITMYCMYKMLCRGYKHPVLNLAASQYGTNPYYIWLQLKDQAKVAVINKKVDEEIDNVDGMMRSNFYIESFDPRR